MYAGLGWAPGQTLTADDVAMIKTYQDNVQDQSALYSSCKQRQTYLAGGILVAAIVGYVIGKHLH